MDTKKLTRLALICAVCVVTRISFRLIPNVQILSPIILILAIEGRLDESIIVSVITMLVTSFYLGFGYWVIFQIIDYGILGIINYLIFNKANLKKTSISKTVAVGLSGFAYGFLISIMQNILMGGSLATFLAIYAGSIPFDINHMFGNAVIYYLLINRIEAYLLGDKQIRS